MKKRASFMEAFFMPLHKRKTAQDMSGFKSYESMIDLEFVDLFDQCLSIQHHPYYISAFRQIVYRNVDIVQP